MECQKFIPEGWIETKEQWDIEQLQVACKEGTVLQGYVERYDTNLNLYVHLGNHIQGIVPKEELEVIEDDKHEISGVRYL